jgi:antirestriction protein ArdC
MSRDLYTEVSQRIIAELENGAAPWVKPWSATPGQNMPCNAVTNRPYSGANVILLWMVGASYASPRYLTYKQAQERGGNVRKGEHGYTVVYVKQMVWKEKDTDEEKHGAMMKAYTVFNIDQCDNLPEKVKTLGAVKHRNHDERDATIDEFIAATGADFREQHSDRACYHVGPDYVEMPKFEGFKSASNFYSVAFHELGHWTGSSTRCGREFGKRFGDHRYAAEELVAELTSAFLCAEFDLDGDLRHPGYIANWIKLLSDDKQAFFTAASKAQHAADYMRGKALAEPEMKAAA